MKRITLLVGLLLSTSPVGAQSRVYTNADLTSKPVTTWTRTVTAEELAGLKAREFHLPSLPPAPDVMIVPHDPTWPFQTSTLEAMSKPLFEPWSMTTYLGHGYGRYGGHASGRRDVSGRPGTAHARPVVSRAAVRSAPRSSARR